MDAPDVERSAPEVTTGGRRAFRPSPTFLLALALAMLGASTYLAMTRRLHPNAYRQASVLSGEWWSYPLEWNPPARLPAVGRDLKDVYAVPGTTTVYAVGELGAVLVSGDDGQTWETPKTRAQTPTPTPTPTPSAALTPTPPGNTNANANANTNTNTNANVNTNAGNTNVGNTNAGNVNGDANVNSGNRNAKAIQRPADDAGALQALAALLDPVPAASAAEPRASAAAHQDLPQEPLPTPTPARRASPRGQSTPAGSRNAQGGPPANVNANSNPAANSPAPAVNGNTNTAAAPTPTPGTPASVEGKALAAVHFYNEREGLAVTEQAECLATRDGGVSWSYCDVQQIGEEFFGLVIRTSAASGAAAPTFPRALAWFAATRDESGEGRLLARIRLNVPPADVAGLFEKFDKIEAEESANTDSNAGSIEAFFVDANEGWLVEGRQFVHHVVLGVTRREDLVEPAFPPETVLRGLFCADGSRCWAAGDRGLVVATRDGWQTFQTQRPASDAEQNLRAVSFRPDGVRGWAVGDAGTILHTEDGGATWVHQARAPRRRADGQTEAPADGGYYFRLLPPAYYLSWVAVALLLLPLRRMAVVDLEEKEPEASVADVLVSDRPLEEGDPDSINFKSIALGLSRFLRNESTNPPLTIAITGEWGTGKSSLMNLLRADLRRYDFRPVWFNAWHHQKEEHLLASLLQNVRLQAVPPFWRPEGLVFRLRLLLIRGARHWGPVLLLLLFAAVAVFYELLRAREGLVGQTYLAQGFKEFAALFYGDRAPDVSDFTKYYLARLPLLVSLLTVAGTVWRGATAFGVNPATLMASMSRGVRVRDLDAQTSFRQRFASEFNDVTKALGARSMLIFIDDLDRCRPENVVETLEAVNFLVTSGECFVVIGMARERVEPCISLSFKDVAAEMPDEGERPEDAVAVLASPAHSEEHLKQIQEAKARRKRAVYARQYLDKLINIEVPVPVPTLAQSRGILVANARREEAEGGAKGEGDRRARLPEVLQAFAREYGRLLLGCALLAALLWGCYRVADLLARPVPAADTARVAASATPTPAATVTPTPAATATPGPTATPGGTPTPTLTSTPMPTPVRAAAAARAELTAGKRSVLLAALPVALVVLTVAWVAVWVLTRRPDLVVKDSPRFVKALETWHPLVVRRSPTPRSVKRFMNRVRYLAMRQRRQDERLPAWRRLLTRVLPEPVSLRLFGPPPAAQPAEGAPIRDELLVALAAVEHLDPDLLEGPDLTSQPRASVGEEDELEMKGLMDMRETAVLDWVKAKHVSTFKEAWDTVRVEGARAEFRRIAKGVKAN